LEEDSVGELVVVDDKGRAEVWSKRLVEGLLHGPEEGEEEGRRAVGKGRVTSEGVKAHDSWRPAEEGDSWSESGWVG